MSETAFIPWAGIIQRCIDRAGAASRQHDRWAGRRVLRIVTGYLAFRSAAAGVGSHQGCDRQRVAGAVGDANLEGVAAGLLVLVPAEDDQLAGEGVDGDGAGAAAAVA